MRTIAASVLLGAISWSTVCSAETCSEIVEQMRAAAFRLNGPVRAAAGQPANPETVCNILREIRPFHSAIQKFRREGCSFPAERLGFLDQVEQIHDKLSKYSAAKRFKC